MANAKQVSREMRRHVAKRSRGLVVFVQENLFRDTPKDTEWAASNWIINAGRPHTHVAGDKINVSYSEAKSSQSIVKRWDPFKGPVYLSNNVPYIGLLDAGYSPQAPPGFVQAAIDQATSRARRL